MKKKKVTAEDFVSPVLAILSTEPGRWWTRYALWDRLETDYPGDAECIKTHVQSYKVPESERTDWCYWFLSGVALRIAELADYEIKQTKQVPEMNVPGNYGYLLRKKE